MRSPCCILSMNIIWFTHWKACLVSYFSLAWNNFPTFLCLSQHWHFWRAQTLASTLFITKKLPNNSCQVIENLYLNTFSKTVKMALEANCWVLILPFSDDLGQLNTHFITVKEWNMDTFCYLMWSVYIQISLILPIISFIRVIHCISFNLDCGQSSWCNFFKSRTISLLFYPWHWHFWKAQTRGFAKHSSVRLGVNVTIWFFDSCKFWGALPINGLKICCHCYF